MIIPVYCQDFRLTHNYKMCPDTMNVMLLYPLRRPLMNKRLSFHCIQLRCKLILHPCFQVRNAIPPEEKSSFHHIY